MDDPAMMLGGSCPWLDGSGRSEQSKFAGFSFDWNPWIQRRL